MGDKLIDFEESIFKSIILVLSFLLFSFGIILSILLLTRKKPLLTITKNEMTVKYLYLGFKTYDVQGDGYEPKGYILNEENPIDTAFITTRKYF